MERLSIEHVKIQLQQQSEMNQKKTEMANRLIDELQIQYGSRLAKFLLGKSTLENQDAVRAWVNIHYTEQGDEEDTFEVMKEKFWKSIPKHFRDNITS